MHLFPSAYDGAESETYYGRGEKKGNNVVGVYLKYVSV